MYFRLHLLPKMNKVLRVLNIMSSKEIKQAHQTKKHFLCLIYHEDLLRIFSSQQGFTWSTRSRDYHSLHVSTLKIPRKLFTRLVLTTWLRCAMSNLCFQNKIWFSNQERTGFYCERVSSKTTSLLDILSSLIVVKRIPFNISSRINVEVAMRRPYSTEKR